MVSLRNPKFLTTVAALCVFLIIQMPQGIVAWRELLKGPSIQMPQISVEWFSPVSSLFGLVLLGLILWRTWWQKTDILYVSPIPVSEQDDGLSVAPKEMRDALRELFVSGDKAFTRLSNIFQDACSQLGGTPINNRGDKGLRELAFVSNRFILDPASSAYAQLRAGLDNKNLTGQQLQELFGSFYEQYQWLTTWTHRLGDLAFVVGYGESEHGEPEPRYRAWKTVDRQFLSELEKLIIKDGFEVVRLKVHQVGLGEGYRTGTYE